MTKDKSIKETKEEIVDKDSQLTQDKVEQDTKDTQAITVTSEVKPAKKKKSKKVVTAGQVHILATFNNTIITATDTSGNSIAAASAGNCGFRGSKKGTAYAAQIAVDKAMTIAKQFGLARADVYVKGIGLGRDSAIRAIASNGVTIESIKDVTGVPHGGCRPKKARRV